MSQARKKPMTHIAIRLAESLRAFAHDSRSKRCRLCEEVVSAVERANPIGDLGQNSAFSSSPAPGPRCLFLASTTRARTRKGTTRRENKKWVLLSEPEHAPKVSSLPVLAAVEPASKPRSTSRRPRPRKTGSEMEKLLHSMRHYDQRPQTAVDARTETDQ